MSRRPRTPVHWPRMKVRGRRNRAKLAARHTTRQIVHVKLDDRDPTTGAISFHAVPSPEATHLIAIDGPTFDGYGRRMPSPARRATVAPRRAAKSKPSSWSVGFSFLCAGEDAFDIITGKGESANGP